MSDQTWKANTSYKLGDVITMPDGVKWQVGASGASEQWLNPERVEAGQVWDADGRLAGFDGPTVIVTVCNDIAYFAGSISAGPAAMVQMRCVGYQLDDGRRVMVGDRFDGKMSDAGVLVILSVVHCGQVVIRGEKDGSTGKVGARFILDTYPTVDASAASVSAMLVGIDAERWQREAPRREIDGILAEDARMHPPFATARRAAVLADMEMLDPVKPPVRGIKDVRRLLRSLRAYEEVRGGGRTPSAGATAMLAEDAALDVYERARGRR